MIKIRTLKDETKKLETLKETPGIRSEDDPFRFQQNNGPTVRSPTGENSDERCPGTSSRGLWHPHRAFWTFCQLRHRENQVSGKRRKEVPYRIHPLKITGMIIGLSILGGTQENANVW